MDSNYVELDLDYYKDKIFNTRSIKALNKVRKTYEENFGDSAGDSEIIKLFDEHRNNLLKYQYRDTPTETPESPVLSYKTSKAAEESKTPETFSDLSVEKPLLLSDIKVETGVNVNDTADNRTGCQNPKDCMVRSLRGLDWVNEEDHDGLVKLIEDHGGLSIEHINNFLKLKNRNIKLVGEVIEGVKLYKWATKEINNNTCSMIMLKLKPNNDPNIKHQYHAVIICNQENVITLWDTQRTMDDDSIIKNAFEDKINDYLVKTDLLDEDFVLVKKESKKNLIEEFKGLKIDSKKNDTMKKNTTQKKSVKSKSKSKLKSKFNRNKRNFTRKPKNLKTVTLRQRRNRSKILDKKRGIR